MEIALTASALNGTECIHLDHMFSVDILPINTHIPVMADLNEYPYLDDVQLQELPNKEISLLIGSDCTAAFREICPRVEGHPDELYALHPVLGWLVIIIIIFNNICLKSNIQTSSVDRHMDARGISVL